MRLLIEVHGRPAPQGSKRTGGAGQLLEQSAYLPAWRLAVKVAAFKAYAAAALDPATLPVFPEHRPVWIERCMFLMAPEQGVVTGKPDIDKLLRSTLDALGGGRYKTARLYDDDSQIVQIDGLRKVPCGTLNPGASIIITDEF